MNIFRCPIAFPRLLFLQHPQRRLQDPGCIIYVHKKLAPAMKSVLHHLPAKEARALGAWASHWLFLCCRRGGALFLCCFFAAGEEAWGSVNKSEY